MSSSILIPLRTCLLILVSMSVIPILPGNNNLMAQEKLPHPISVNTVSSQGLNFGAFMVGPSGGTVTVNAGGSRSATGSIALIGMGYIFTPALFEIEANPGTVVALLNGPDATLTGNNGGTITLHLGTSIPATPFVTTAVTGAFNPLTVGGTLTIPAGSPPGSYSGSFYIIFVQE